MAGINNNLIPPKKGEIRNPSGKPKGTKHLSTIIQELAENIDWSKTDLPNKEELNEKYGRNGFKAVAYIALTKAMKGDTRAMEWLAKHGYGEKQIHEFENGLFSDNTMKVEIVDGEHKTESKTEDGS